MTYQRNSLSPMIFPCAWAADWGEDHYGLWQALVYQGVSYVFRWIEPGVFLMGSPENEAGRISEGGNFYGTETQHEVTISRGFWIGETTVTQALWEAVMNENPSYFTANKMSVSSSENHPVEQVSWKDAQDFIAKLNLAVDAVKQRVPQALVDDDMQFALPTEVQWEYACRAGTTTPFHFGENITPEQVNYDGNYPYKDAKKGKYRQQTVAVESLPCNNWGLYEMHGNVWEWCEDGYQADLGSKAVSDPQGNPQASLRVLRGGSWSNYGRFVRSAFRSTHSPDDRYDGIGLRLSFRSSSLAKP